MLDPKLLRENPELIKKDLEKRKDQEKLALLEKAITLDKTYREQLQKIQSLRHERNAISKEIAQAKKQGKDPKELLEKASSIPQEIKKLEEKNETIQQELRSILMRLPNLLHESVPYGESEEDNEIIALFGEKPSFTFPLKSHVDLLIDLDIADLERAAKISGARFYFLKNEGALLDYALQRYAIDFMLKRGFTLIEPPLMMRKQVYEGVTDLHDFEDVMYKIEDDDLYLIATSEHPLVSMWMNEILDEKQLPLKFVGISSCFRKEAGSHGKDTKGIFRVHQFNKVEQVVIAKPEDSWKIHEELIKHAEEFFQSLGLHFRKVNICTGDIGTVAAKKYDLEVWMPVQQTYREVVSCSNVTDYQARRLKIRYRTAEGNKLVHTLNSTVVATSRAIVAILENYQQPDGSVKIPDVLVPYMNGITAIKPKLRS